MTVPAPNPQEQRHQRYDAGVLRPSHRTDEGYLVCEAFIARPGVYEYVQPDGTVIRELVPAEELHRADSLGTLALKPATLEHPPEDVTPDNYMRYATGDVGNEISVVEGGYVKVVVTAKRRDAIVALDGGVRETSPGYTCRIEEGGGMDPEHGQYDRIQRDRRYNHLAITQRARGGPTIHARVDGATITAPVRGAYQRRTDSLWATLPASGTSPTTKKEDTMNEEQIKRMIAQGITEGLARRDSDDKKDAMEKKYDELKAKYDALMEKLEGKSKKDDDGEEEDGEDKFEKFKKKADSADFKAYFNARQKLLDLAITHRLDSAEVEKLENHQLAKAIVLKATPTARKDGDERYYIDALDFIQGEQRNDSAPFPDPYKQIEGAFGGGGDGNQPQGRQDGGDPAPVPMGNAWATSMNKQMQDRHKR